MNAGKENEGLTQGRNGSILTYIRIKDASTDQEVTKDCIRMQNKAFYADRVLQGPEQEELFKLIHRNILEKCIRGYNCSVFAYGQTGSGKTYTIQGTESQPGLVLRSMEYLHGIYETLRLSFVEIYNENMIDLLGTETGTMVSIRDDPVEGVALDNLTVVSSASMEESAALYNRGIQGRRTACTNMNMHSSRSHSIFTIFLDQKDRSIMKRSKLCFVDLAGSERCREVETERMKETCNINKSLLCLGKIVNALSRNERGHISYRDSKLTFMLKDSLGGNSRLAIVGNVSLESYADTLSTLHFLQRSRMINNCPSINYNTAGASVPELAEALRLLDEENQALREEVAQLRSEKEQSLKSAVAFTVKKLVSDVEYVREKVERIKNISNQISEEKFSFDRKMILKISDALALLNSERREGIRNLCIKKRKAE